MRKIRRFILTIKAKREQFLLMGVLVIWARGSWEAFLKPESPHWLWTTIFILMAFAFVVICVKIYYNRGKIKGNVWFEPDNRAKAITFCLKNNIPFDRHQNKFGFIDMEDLVRVKLGA